MYKGYSFRIKHPLHMRGNYFMCDIISNTPQKPLSSSQMNDIGKFVSFSCLKFGAIKLCELMMI